jgi:stringent starvation protein B
MAETSTKPYMIRALHEWCTDNGYTPQISVQVDANTMVPPAHIRDGQITLNIGSLATNRLVISNEAIEFQARFSGVTENLYVPIGAVTAIYARETGAGMGFEVEGSVSDSAAKAGVNGNTQHEQSKQGAPVTTTTAGPEPKRPTLTIVK